MTRSRSVLIPALKWIAAYKDLEVHVKAHEQQSCLTYYFGTPEVYGEHRSATTHMLAYECYRTRDDLYDTHFNSSAMGVFLSKIHASMTTGLDLVHYEDVTGFLDRANLKECGVIWDTKLKIKPGKREEILKRLVKVAEWVESNEPGTYTYFIHKGLDDEHEVRILERYADRSALERHQSGKVLLNFFDESKDLIAQMENHGYIPNGLGWLHR